LKNLNNSPESIFTKLYSKDVFVDRFLLDPAAGVDVIIPIMHTNELWLKNIHSIYREIPVNRLIISDDGCVDDSIDIVRKFPRVTVLNHRDFKSLGFSLRKLIENVQSEWFVYLHSDVYLPPAWFDHMCAARSDYDWFESAQRTTVLVEVPLTYAEQFRAASGSQMGRKAAFETVLPRIDDDFLYRTEDIVLARLINDAGYRYGRVNTTFCHHQLMDKKSLWTRKVDSITVSISRSPEEEAREYETQLYGLLKYLKPDPDDFNRFQISYLISKMIELDKLNYADFEGWVKTVNPGWWILISQDRNKRRLLRIEELLLSPINKMIGATKWLIRKCLLSAVKLIRSIKNANLK
jgi:glycosyltransferase involved in cell wall biosynthesis